MGLKEKIGYAKASKELIRQAIIEKEVECDPTVPLRQYEAKISSITVGEGSGGGGGGDAPWPIEPFVLDEDCPTPDTLSSEMAAWFSTLPPRPSNNTEYAFLAVYKDFPVDENEFLLINGFYERDSTSLDFYYYYKFSDDDQTYARNLPGVRGSYSEPLKVSHTWNNNDKFKYAFIVGNLRLSTSVRYKKQSPCYYCWCSSKMTQSSSITQSSWEGHKSNTNLIRPPYTNAIYLLTPGESLSGTDFNSMFYNCGSLTSIPLLNTSNGTSFSYTFGGCSSLTSIPQLDTSNGTDFGYMFNSCSNLISIPQLDTSNGTSFNHMFYNCGSLTSIPLLNTSNGTSFRYMFNGCSSLASIPQLNTSKGTSFTNMFSSCSCLTSIPALDTSNGTNFSYMFYNCGSLTSIPLLNTSNGTNFGYMFYSCSSLTSIPALDTGKGTDFGYMFYNCGNLISIPALDTSKGTNFNRMFYSCGSLTSIPLLNTSNGTSFSYMFNNCYRLTSIPQLNTSKGTDFNSMFYNCYSLTSIPALDTSNGTNFSYMFYNCSNILSLGTEQVTDKNGNLINSWIFKKSVDFGSCPLDLASISHVMNNLASGVSSSTFKLSSTSKSYLQAEPATNGTSANLFDQLVAEAQAKGWTVSY